MTKWNDAYLPQIYDLAKQGMDDNEIAEEMGVRLHVIRRWLRSNETLAAMVERARQEVNEPDDDAVQEPDTDESKILDMSHLKKTQMRFLACYAQTGNVSRAARLAGVSRENHYRWIEDPQYQEVFEMADQIAVDSLEQEAWRRGRDGRIRYKFNHMGRPLMIECEPDEPGARRREDEDGNVWYEKHYCEAEYSDTLLIFLLKARRPELFRDKPIEINNQNNSIGLDLNQLLRINEENTNVIEGDVVEKQAQALIEAHNGND